MRPPRFRVRALMVAVGVVALLIWGGMMGSRAYDHFRLVREYSEQERAWRQIAARGRWDPRFASECAEYYSRLARKYRQAMWRPWMAVAPDPHAPGYDLWVEQECGANEVSPGPAASGAPPIRTK